MLNRKAFIFCCVIVIVAMYSSDVHANIFEKMFSWISVPCDRADDMVREGIQKFYHDNKAGTGFIKRAVESCTNNEEFVYNLGVAYYKTGNLENAVSAFQKAIRINSSFRKARVALAWTLVMGEIDIDKGMDIAESLIEKEEGSSLLYIMGHGYRLKGDAGKWSKWVRKANGQARKENKININQYLNAINENETEGDRDLAERKHILYAEIGLLYERIGDYDLSVEFLKKADSSYGWWNLGRLYARYGDPALAKQYLKMALDFSSGLSREDVKTIKSDIKNINNPLYFKKDMINFIYPEEFVFIPAGEFTMGTTDGPVMEQPEHTVFLDAFIIGKYEVTNTEYKVYVDSTGHIPPYNCCKTKYDMWDKNRIPAKIMNKPVVNVSWHDVVRYIGWKNKQFGKKYRLPTEAEWEKAARAGEKRIYPWGNAPPSLKIAYYGRHWDGLDTFVDVDSYENGKSFYGVHNMSGSVWEWCYDWFGMGYYKKGAKKNPRGPNKGEFKVLRGGSWMNLSRYITTTFRNRNWPKGRYSGIGFRLVGDL